MDISSQALKEAAPRVLAALCIILIPLALAWVPQQLSARGSPAKSWLELAQAVMVPAMMLVLFCTVAAHSAVVWDASEQLFSLIGLYGFRNGNESWIMDSDARTGSCEDAGGGAYCAGILGRYAQCAGDSTGYFGAL